MIVLSPSPGSSQRGTGLKCMAKVSVPSGVAAADDMAASGRRRMASPVNQREAARLAT